MKMVGLEMISEEREKVVVVVDHEEEEKKKEGEVALPGFRFHPTDEELVGFYLRRKVEKKPLSIEIIKQIDIYKYEPWDLPKACTVGGHEKEWYFFCLRGRKYRNSIRPNRVTGSGFWKATGIDRPIYPTSDSNDDCIGLKKSLVYYRGSAGKGTKTDWMMHEFRLPSKNDNTKSPSAQEAEIWTICRIFKRNISFMKKYTQNWKQSISKQASAGSSSNTSSFESEARDHHVYPTNYYEARNNYQNLGGQWNSTLQAPIPAALHPSVAAAAIAVTPSTNGTNEISKDGNWDELGRIMEFMLDTNTTSECTYY